MGNHKMGHRQTQVNSISPRLLKVSIAKIHKQPIEIKVIQPFNFVIPTHKSGNCCWKSTQHKFYQRWNIN
jgi:hypothetical protein